MLDWLWRRGSETKPDPRQRETVATPLAKAMDTKSIDNWPETVKAGALQGWLRRAAWDRGLPPVAYTLIVHLGAGVFRDGRLDPIYHEEIMQAHGMSEQDFNAAMGALSAGGYVGQCSENGIRVNLDAKGIDVADPDDDVGFTLPHPDRLAELKRQRDQKASP